MNIPVPWILWDVGITFCQEILGYNVHMNFDAPGPGQVDAYFGLTGCRTYNDVSDRGCDQGVAWCEPKFIKVSGIE